MEIKDKLREKTIKLIGAHNGMTAKLAEITGFDAIWASGLEISTSIGYPDASMITMKEFLERAVEMKLAVDIPIIADCDSGFGSLASLKRTVNEYEKLGISGIVIEDKKFPKDNSFIDTHQKLFSKEEFSYMLKKSLEYRQDKNFLIIGRMESLIVGEDENEALERAELYLNTGIDLLLIHSKAKNKYEILRFLDLLRNKVGYRANIAIIPTTYHDITENDISEYNIKMVIYANQGIRTILGEVYKTYKSIFDNQSTSEIESRISSVDDIFKFIRYDELKKEEREMREYLMGHRK